MNTLPWSCYTIVRLLHCAPDNSLLCRVTTCVKKPGNVEKIDHKSGRCQVLLDVMNGTNWKGRRRRRWTNDVMQNGVTEVSGKNLI